MVLQIWLPSKASNINLASSLPLPSKMNKAIATTQWFIYGRKHFRKAGYERHRIKYDSPVQSRADIGLDVEGADGVDLRGKVVVITGANSGLGKEITTYAAAKGANVYMICRSKERAEEARDEIVKLTANDNVKIVLADVSEYSQVKAAAKTLQTLEPKIDCLICNAGALLNEKRLTSEGNESTIASHLIGGSYLLSQLLLPQLKASAASTSSSSSSTTTAPSRVIFTTSGGMYLTPLPSWEIATSTAPDHTYDGVMAYSYAKRGQVILAEECAKLHPEIRWMSAHPGWTLTAAVEDAFGDEKKYLEPMRNTWEGAEGLTWLMGREEGLENGALYLDRETQVKHMAGPFFSEGRFTKNSEGEVRDFMENLRKASGLS